MDCAKVGNLIYNLRKEKGMTQKELALQMNISDKTISKWERGLGCPDVSLLPQLSQVLGVNIEQILTGSLNEKDTNGGNMKRIQFYICKSCNNVITATSSAEVSCCGRKLEAEKITQNESMTVTVQPMESEQYVTIDHPMTKDHYISFAAYVTYDSVWLVKLYAEQSAEFRVPAMRKGKLYVYCTQHGLLETKL